MNAQPPSHALPPCRGKGISSHPSPLGRGAGVRVERRRESKLNHEGYERPDKDGRYHFRRGTRSKRRGGDRSSSYVSEQTLDDQTHEIKSEFGGLIGEAGDHF